jgi:aminodeoxyfutalosine synthase
MESMIEQVAERVAHGTPLSGADARAILESHDLIAVGMMADDVRRRMHGARTTFVRVFEAHVDAPPSSLPGNVTAGELRIVGRPGSIDTAVAATRAMKGIAGAVTVSGFSLADLKALAGSEGRTLADVCVALREAGLEAIAEVPVDADGVTAVDVAAARGAGLAVRRMTVSALPDHERISTVERARDLQEAAGGFQIFAPLPRTIPVAKPSTGYDDVKQVALARLLVTNIASIQVDWALYGPKLAQVALTLGADDVDGIAAVETGALGARRSAIEEIRGNIRAAALEPVERNGRLEAVGA